MNFENKIVVITGAYGGIGKALCKALSSQGAHIIACGRNQEKLDALAKDITANNQNAKIQGVLMDISDLASIHAGVAKLTSLVPLVDILINNAGYTDIGNPGAYTTSDGYDLVEATNVIGPVLLTELLVPLLRNSQRAQVLNVASTAVMKFYNPNKKLFMLEEATDLEDKRSTLDRYAESKMAIAMYSTERAETLRPEGILMNPLILKDVKMEPGKDADWSFGVKLLNWVISPLKISREKAAQLFIDCLKQQDLPEFYGSAISSSAKPAKLPKYAVDQTNLNNLMSKLHELTGLDRTQTSDETSEVPASTETL